MSFNQNIDELLSSLDGASRAEPKPFFPGRVMQRIQMGESTSFKTDWPRLVWGFSAVAILIILNLILFFSQMRSTDQNTISEWESTTPRWVVDYTQNPGSSFYDTPNK